MVVTRQLEAGGKKGEWHVALPKTGRKKQNVDAIVLGLRKTVTTSYTLSYLGHFSLKTLLSAPENSVRTLE